MGAVKSLVAGLISPPTPAAAPAPAACGGLGGSVCPASPIPCLPPGLGACLDPSSCALACCGPCLCCLCLPVCCVAGCCACESLTHFLASHAPSDTDEHDSRHSLEEELELCHQECELEHEHHYAPDHIITEEPHHWQHHHHIE